MNSKVKLNEIFDSIDGEVNQYGQGHITKFIRFSGCNINCEYCDTKYHTNYTEVEIDKILQEVVNSKIDKITITGGEPLLQLSSFIELATKLSEFKKIVTVETNGTIFPLPFIKNVSYVVDYKLPSSGFFNKMKIENFIDMQDNTILKFVIFTEEDFKEALKLHNFLSEKYITSFSCGNKFDPKRLVDLMIENEINSIFNYQIHKILNLK